MTLTCPLPPTHTLLFLDRKKCKCERLARGSTRVPASELLVPLPSDTRHLLSSPPSAPSAHLRLCLSPPVARAEPAPSNPAPFPSLCWGWGVGQRTHGWGQEPGASEAVGALGLGLRCSSHACLSSGLGCVSLSKLGPVTGPLCTSVLSSVKQGHKRGVAYGSHGVEKALA